MNDAIVAILDKMHSALSHIPDVLPSMSGMRVQLGSIRADIDRLRDQLAPEAEAVVETVETDARARFGGWAEEKVSAPFMPADAPPIDPLIPADTVDGPAVDPSPPASKKSPAAAAAAAAKP